MKNERLWLGEDSHSVLSSTQKPYLVPRSVSRSRQYKETSGFTPPMCPNFDTTHAIIVRGSQPGLMVPQTHKVQSKNGIFLDVPHVWRGFWNMGASGSQVWQEEKQGSDSWTVVKQLEQLRNSRSHDDSNEASKWESERLPASTREQSGPQRRGITNLSLASQGADLASAGFQNKPCARTLKESYYRKRKIPAKHEVRGKQSPSPQQLFMNCSHPKWVTCRRTTELKAQMGYRELKGQIMTWIRAQQLWSEGPGTTTRATHFRFWNVYTYIIS